MRWKNSLLPLLLRVKLSAIPQQMHTHRMYPAEKTLGILAHGFTNSSFFIVDMYFGAGVEIMLTLSDKEK